MKKLTITLFLFLTLAITNTVNAAEVILNPTTPQTTVTTSATETVFARSLTIGSSGRDVMALKKILSLELKTTQDTSATFTTNTAAEVKKLQEKYALEILIPNGLSAGTGYAGPSTIKKLNQLAPTYFIKLSDFVVPTIVTASVKEAFSLSLKLGSISDEVVLLKSVLNSDPETALSPKNTTTIYDLATQIAVNKFQEKYASEVLAPSGLTSGTGTVGPATRKKLNSLLNQTISTIVTPSTSSPVTSATTQTFTLTGSVSDSSVLSQKCEGTTLVVTKSGFGSTYETRTTNSNQCGYASLGQTYVTPPYIPPVSSSGSCTKTTYSTGPWGACSGGVQTRTVTKIVSTTTCPYYDYSFAPASSQSCKLSECPSDQPLKVYGEVGTIASCELYGNVYVMKSGTRYSYGNNIECTYTKNRLVSLNPLTAGVLAGTGYYNAPADLKAIGELLPNLYYCVVMFADTGNYRILNPANSEIKIQP